MLLEFDAKHRHYLRTYKRDFRFAWLTPLQRQTIRQLAKEPIKPSSIKIRRKVVFKNLIGKGLVEHQSSPDLYAITEMGRDLLERGTR